MPRVKFSEVLSFSSEDINHPAENLLSNQTFRKWKIAATEVGKQASVTLRLEKLSTVRSVDIGNDGCAFVEVLVARDESDFEVLLAASSFMSPVEARNQTEVSRVRMFGPEKLSKAALEQKWSRVKLVCTQPFNKQLQFGLAFVSLNAPDAPVSKTEESSESSSSNLLLGAGLKLQDEEDEDSGISVGSLFARRKEAPAPQLTGAAAIRAASAAAVSSAAQAPLSAATAPASSKRKNPDDSQGFYQLKKKPNTSTDSGRATSPSSHNKNKHSQANNTNNPSKESPNNNNDTKNINNLKAKATPSNTPSNNNTNNRKTDTNPKKNPSLPKQSNNKTNDNSFPSTAAPGAAKGRPSSNRRVVDITQPSEGSRGSATPQRQYVPYSALMRGVVYALSGYVNPQRSNLRDRMTAMGAKYKAAWDRSCTHLICAFANTPKYNEVRGKGKIVSHRWIDDCYTFKKKMPWKKYRLDQDGSSDDSEEEVWAEELRPKTCLAQTEPAAAGSSASGGAGRGGENATTMASDTDVQPGPAGAATTPTHGAPMSPSDDEAAYGGQTDASDDEENTDDEIQRALAKKATVNGKGPTAAAASSSVGRGEEESTDAYDDDTDVDEEAQSPRRKGKRDTSSLPLPSLLSCFTGKVFFLYGGPQREDCIRRYIVAFDGTISEYMDKSVHFVVTENDWDSTFDEALSSHPRLRFVRPAWVWSCSDEGKAVPYQQHEIKPH